MSQKKKIVGNPDAGTVDTTLKRFEDSETKRRRNFSLI